MKKNLFSALCSLFVFGSLLSSCGKEDKGEFVGPEYRLADENLEVTGFSATQDQIDFTNDSLPFTGEFNQEVTYQISMKGLNSGAVKEVRGFGNSINGAESFWDGAHDDNYFFQKGEDVVTTLSFWGNDSKFHDTVTISEVKPREGLLFFQGFERSVRDWPDELAFGDDNDAEMEYGEARQNGPALTTYEGNNYFYMKGEDFNGNYFSVGVRDYAAPIYDYFPFEEYQPEEIYFNVFVYGTGRPNVRFAINVAEDDNYDGDWDGEVVPSEDVFVYETKIDWTGWKLVSARYSDFKPSADPAEGGTGNKKKETDRATQVTFQILSDPPYGEVDAAIDYPIATFGKPFNPNE